MLTSILLAPQDFMVGFARSFILSIDEISLKMLICLQWRYSMLYKLEVENFFSVRDPQVLDLSVDGKVPDPEGRYAPIFEGADVRAPKVVAIYGANA
jgi:hypothetical protein